MRALALALFLATPILATAQPGASTRIGLGVHLRSGTPLLDLGSDISALAAPQFSVPIDVNGLVRIEPQIGYVSAQQERGSFSVTNRQTSLGLAAGALVPHPDLTLTIGGRVSYVRFASEIDSGGDSRETQASALGIGPLVGGEYPFSDRFALGAEAGVQYLSFSDDDDSDASASAISTNAAVSVRYFF